MSGGFLGVIGGMGPLATADFLRKLVECTPASDDQANVPVVMWGDCGTPDRTQALLGDGPSPLEHLRAAADGLVKAGARRLVIACNTAHAWAEEIAAQSPVPLIHIAEAAAEEAVRRGARRVGLMATRGTILANFYPSRLAVQGIAVQLPDEAQQRCVDQGIALVKAGRPAEGRRSLAPVFEQLMTDGCDAVLLACTEIPVALHPAPPEAIDTTACLAQAAANWWKEHTC